MTLFVCLILKLIMTHTLFFLFDTDIFYDKYTEFVCLFNTDIDTETDIVCLFDTDTDTDT